MFHHKSVFVDAIILFVLALPLFAFAGDAAHIFPGGYWAEKGLLSCGGNTGRYCTSVCDLLQTAQNVVSFLTTLLFFIGVPVFVMWGGFLIITAGGSPDKVKEGRKVITDALIGAVIALGAFLIIQTFLWAIGAYPNNKSAAETIPWPTIQCNAR